MKIMKDNIEKLFSRTSYNVKEEHLDKQENIFLNCWCFFEENEKEIMDITDASLEVILYSKYYWCTLYKKRFNELNGNDVGIDQQQYKIIEEMNQRLDSVDWKLIQMMEEGI